MWKQIITSTRLYVNQNLILLTSRFSVAVGLFSNDYTHDVKMWHISRWMSVSLMFLPCFDIFCDLLLNICTATWNLFVLYNTEVKRFITVTSFMHLSSNRSQIATNQNEHRINHILETYILRLGFARFFFFYGNLKLVLQIDRD